MSEPYPDPDPDGETESRTPRWVKVFGIIALIVILIVAILLVVSGPEAHGPARHLSTAASAGDPTLQGPTADSRGSSDESDVRGEAPLVFAGG